MAERWFSAWASVVRALYERLRGFAAPRWKVYCRTLRRWDAAPPRVPKRHAYLRARFGGNVACGNLPLCSSLCSKREQSNVMLESLLRHLPSRHHAMHVFAGGSFGPPAYIYTICHARP